LNSALHSRERKEEQSNSKEFDNPSKALPDAVDYLNSIEINRQSLPLRSNNPVVKEYFNKK
jgi:hypothetical protein